MAVGFRKYAITLVIFWMACLKCFSSHVVGGHFEMKANPTNFGQFKVSLKLYYDDENASSLVPKSTYKVAIYRKSDNLQMTTFLVAYQDRVSLIYSNRVCATLRSLKTSEITYSKDIFLDPEVYDNPNGYYVISEICCRNPNIDNIKTPGDVGNAFYMEFPPLKLNGIRFKNSSPSFNTPTGEYICRTEPFKTSFEAVDSDGDILEYTLVTPFAGNGDFFNTEMISPGPNYPLVVWNSGFSASNAIPGTPPLSIDNRGQLTVTSDGLVNQLYVFCVEVKEYRMINNTKTLLGLVRKDFQFLVVDCPNIKPNDPSFTVNGNAIGNEISICGNQTIKLEAEQNPNWNYQWLRDNIVLSGESSSSIQVSIPGKYQLKTSYKDICSKSNTSTEFTVKTGLDVNIEEINGKNEFCTGSTTTLKSSVSGANYTYQWMLDNTLLIANSDKLEISESGEYQLKVTESSGQCNSTSNKIKLIKRDLPTPVITTTKSKICVGETTYLQVSTLNGKNYEWYLDGSIIPNAQRYTLETKQYGKYTLLLTDQFGCQGKSNEIEIELATNIPVNIDPVPAICGVDAPVIKLKASPLGGFFEGTGVENLSVFNPKLAGVGEHEITYIFSSSNNQCVNKGSTKIIVVKKPTSILDDKIISKTGAIITLDATSPEGLYYKWTPTLDLSNPSVSNPKLLVTKPVFYTVKITSVYSCSAEYKVDISVEDRLMIPTAISPNGDGINDFWEIFNSEQYPTMEVSLFDRWGNLIFYSNDYKSPFDGKINGALLPNGVYLYKIKSKYLYEGTLSILY